MRLILLLLVLSSLVSCEDKEKLELTNFKGTWKTVWKQCGTYYNSNAGSISFTFNDTIDNVGIVKELKADTLFSTSFRFEFLDLNTLHIDSIYTVGATKEWLGTHQLSSVSSKRFILQRQNAQCENELYKFSK